VLALAVMSTAFTSLAVATGFERRYAVIKRLGATPLGREGLLLGKTAALVIVQLIQFAVITGVGLALGWRPSVSLLGVLATVIMGTAAFATWGLFLAGTLRAEATLAAANLIYLLLLAGGAVVLPATTYGGLGSLVQWLPSGALGESMRAALVDGSIDFTRLAVLAAWALAGGVLTARSFRWE
ncbi:MAG: ABC transporter permease, partial [Nocardioides sp.]